MAVIRRLPLGPNIAPIPCESDTLIPVPWRGHGDVGVPWFLKSRDCPTRRLRFEDLAPGNYYVEVTSLKRSKRSTSITMKDTLGSSHVFRYGTATVYGEVVDRQAGRAPLPGIGLSLRVSPRRRSFSPEQEEFSLEWKQSAPMKEDLYARTDDRGTYVFDELPTGKFSMT